MSFSLTSVCIQISNPKINVLDSTFRRINLLVLNIVFTLNGFSTTQLVFDVSLSEKWINNFCCFLDYFSFC